MRFIAVEIPYWDNNEPFEDIIDTIGYLIAQFYYYRPGLILIPSQNVIRPYGSEEQCAQQIAEKLADDNGVECVVGAGPGILGSAIAARSQVFLPDNTSCIDSYPLQMLSIIFDNGHMEKACHTLIDEASFMGITTLGQLKSLGKDNLSSQWPDIGDFVYQLLVDGMFYGHSVRPRPGLFCVSYSRDDPAYRSTELLFIFKKLCVDLSKRLQKFHQLCVELAIRLGHTYEQRWFVDAISSDHELFQRCQWQMEAWQGDIACGIDTISIEAVRTVPVATARESLWGGHDDQSMIDQYVQRIETLLGEKSVYCPIYTGGFTPRDKVQLVGYCAWKNTSQVVSMEQKRDSSGDVDESINAWRLVNELTDNVLDGGHGVADTQKMQRYQQLWSRHGDTWYGLREEDKHKIADDKEDVWTPWQGELILPSPPIIYELPRPCTLIDFNAHYVDIAEGKLSGDVAFMKWAGHKRAVMDVEGPWLIHGRWWKGACQRFYMRLICDSNIPTKPDAYLLFYEDGWYIDGEYRTDIPAHTTDNFGGPRTLKFR